MLTDTIQNENDLRVAAKRFDELFAKLKICTGTELDELRGLCDGLMFYCGRNKKPIPGDILNEFGQDARQAIMVMVVHEVRMRLEAYARGTNN